jgi:hypothetical protein
MEQTKRRQRSGRSWQERRLFKDRQSLGQRRRFRRVNFNGRLSGTMLLYCIRKLNGSV